MAMSTVLNIKDTIKEVLTSQFWNSLSLGSLERVRIELRDLLQYIDGGKSDKTFTVNIEDTFQKDNTGISVTPSAYISSSS